jgi:hypothetical protein
LADTIAGKISVSAEAHGMTKKTVRLAPAAIVLALASALPHGAAAQQEAVARCRAMPNDAERIACLEAALTAVEPERGGLRIPIPFLGGDDNEEEERNAAAPASPAAPAPSAAPASLAAPAESALGAEQVAVREGTFDDEPAGDDDDLRLDAEIAIAQTDGRGLLVVQLDNGQVWRQTENETLPVRVDIEQKQPVRITESGFGGYRMYLATPDREIKVARVR